MTLTIRPLAPEDRDAWSALWRDYLTFYKSSVPQEVYDSSFERMLGDDPRDFSGMIALKEGEAVGLVHYLFHRHGWKIEEVCYLQDLYVSPAARGTGAGRKLIEVVYAAADAHGAPSVYWLTQDGNATARQLYDRIATKSDFIKYQR
ncbi:GNAT family N-acetyltransferase [Pontivivens insulae]|uniref:N-acetyltransferase domain-containing protein n=1 Tax=Pontivivens insulae TaxID=1639689 RepID=A0A2R8A9K8_9RHOB|nr:GNAT family N-acetyltransferase [Pontivivens insulae]RED12826.1 acetyltransferase (GNAT) family protein [Pontivivens insulae]SPF28917.1 hypothetical protein POI8812_01220 [Pontivivens insulae]